MSSLMIVLVVLSLLYFTLETFANGISTLRIRLSTGELIRLDLDDDTQTINQIYQKLLTKSEMAQLSSVSKIETSKLEIKGKIFQLSSDENIFSLGVRNGEIINILQEKSFNKTSLKSNITTSEKKLVSTVHKKKIVSMASIQARKLSLEKITRQKSTKSHSVFVNPSSSIERIMSRMTEHGGLAILLGKTETQVQKAKTISTKTSISSISSNSTASRNVTSIEAICEVFLQNPIPNGSDRNLQSQSFINQVTSSESVTMIEKVQMFAENLGLDVVGFCVHIRSSSQSTTAKLDGDQKSKSTAIRSSSQSSEPTRSVWTNDHIYISSYLRKMFTKSSTPVTPSLCKDLFPIILCVSKTSDKHQLKSDTKRATGNSKVSLQKGLSIEAFKLSDQAMRLIDKGLVALQKDSQSSASSHSSSSSSGSSSNAKTNHDEKVQLTSEVLLKNEETTEVDPLLLAVPMSIIHKQPTASAIVETNLLKSPFHHSFPTPSEINSKTEMSILAKKYSDQILQKLVKNNVDAVRKKLRDVHLLLYLSDILDMDTVRNIASCAADGASTIKLSQRSVMALQMSVSALNDNIEKL